MSHLVKIKTDVFKKELRGYISNDDFYKIQELFEEARKRYESQFQQNLKERRNE